MSDRMFSDDNLRAVADRMTGEPRPPVTPSSTEQSSGPSMMWPMVAAGVGDLGDIISTRIAMSHGADEANPLVPGKNHPWGNTAVLGAQALGTQLLIRALSRSHPDIAKFIGYGTGALGGFNTMRNMHNVKLWDEYNSKQGR